MIRAGIIFLALAAGAFSAELRVSPSGSHSAPFATWATAATNINAAINAASNGDTVRIAPGTYGSAESITLNLVGKTLDIVGGRGTLIDADRTIVLCGTGAAPKRCAYVNISTNSTLRGLTFAGSSNNFASCYFVNAPGSSMCCSIVRNNARGPSFYAGDNNTLYSSIVVGNGVYGFQLNPAAANVTNLLENCIIECNVGDQVQLGSGVGVLYNNILGSTNSGGYTFISAGNVQSNTTNSVTAAWYPVAHTGSGTSLVWRGVASYISRMQSAAATTGVGRAGSDTRRDGVGGPRTSPMGGTNFVNAGPFNLRNPYIRRENQGGL